MLLNPERYQRFKTIFSSLISHTQPTYQLHLHNNLECFYLSSLIFPSYITVSIIICDSDFIVWQCNAFSYSKFYLTFLFLTLLKGYNFNIQITISLQLIKNFHWGFHPSIVWLWHLHFYDLVSVCLTSWLPINLWDFKFVHTNHLWVCKLILQLCSSDWLEDKMVQPLWKKV